MKAFNLICRYFDFNGKVFSEVIETLAIKEFGRAGLINSLVAFPLQHHSDREKAEIYFEMYGKQFMSMMSSHYY